jgi:hypothetical protein
MTLAETPIAGDPETLDRLVDILCHGLLVEDEPGAR